MRKEKKHESAETKGHTDGSVSQYNSDNQLCIQANSRSTKFKKENDIVTVLKT